MDIPVKGLRVLGTGEWGEGMNYKDGAPARFADVYDDSEGAVMRVSLAQGVLEGEYDGVVDCKLSVTGQTKAYDAGDRGLQTRSSIKLKIVSVSGDGKAA